jgi:hypothetical protein
VDGYEGGGALGARELRRLRGKGNGGGEPVRW